ncbi:MAG: hypothetical protein KJO41_09080, partial [Bacteroidia bacterium]|nr:hypothetical protein [Bacteroidia bacterium]
MKKGMYLLFLGLLLSFSSIAQTGINYKAYITDDLGNALVDQSIILEITIKIGDGMAIIYSESHNAMTDENGMVMINIGQGTPIIGDFTDILWGSDEHFLNVQVDIGSGLVDMGTTQFMSVPYALYAPSLGLEKIWEGGSPGWRLADTNPDAYGDIGLAATDISISLTSNNSTYGATGNYSFANGYQTTASGSQSMAGGLQTVASGLNSFASGNYTKAEA